jgi:hypothetical protein
MCLCDVDIGKDLCESLLLGPIRTSATTLQPDATFRTDRLWLEMLGTHMGIIGSVKINIALLGDRTTINLG